MAFSFGTGASVVVNAISFPLLSIFYSPKEYGNYSLVIYLSGIFAAIASLRLEVALASETREERIGVIFRAALYCSGLIAALCFLVTFFVPGVGGSGYIALFSGVYCFLFGILSLLSAVLVKQGKFYFSGNMLMLYSIFTLIFQIGLAYIGLADIGLYVGTSLALAFAIAMALTRDGCWRVLRGYMMQDNMSVSSVLREYRGVWTYNTAQSTLNASSLWLLAHSVSILGGASAVAFFSVCQRILVIPVRMIGNSLRQVLLKNLSEVNVREGRAIAKKFTILLIPIVVGVFGLACILLPYFVKFFMAGDWSGLESYVLPLSIWLSVTVLYVPSISYLNVKKIVWPHFAYELCVFVVRALALWAGLVWTLNSLEVVYISSIFSFVIGMIFIGYSLFFKREN